MRSFPASDRPRARHAAIRAALFAPAAVWALIGVRCDFVVPRQGWNDGWGPLVPHETFPGDCGLCHVSSRWDEIRDDFAYDHEKETGFALEGAHAGAACLRCHNDRGPVRAYVARGCGGCHVDPHQSQLGQDCERCHDQNTWRPGGPIAEHARTSFPLFGAHAVTPCIGCHDLADVGDFRRVSTACEACHQDDLSRAAVPNHADLGWTTACQRCHTPLGWNRAGIVHDSFPLVGGHSGVACSSCHAGGVYHSTPSDCSSCHSDDYARAPNHAALGYPTDCTRCHGTSSWSGSTFVHRFPLSGPHDEPCGSCHQATVSTFNCLACHAHNRTSMDDKHKEERGYSYDSAACYRCHPNGRH